jgi:hypothetical protein
MQGFFVVRPIFDDPDGGYGTQIYMTPGDGRWLPDWGPFLNERRTAQRREGLRGRGDRELPNIPVGDFVMLQRLWHEKTGEGYFRVVDRDEMLVMLDTEGDRA